MDQNRRLCSLPACFGKFINPASIICHFFTAEQTRIIKTGIIDQDDYGFAADVQAAVVVPAVFRGHYAETDKDRFRVLDSDFLLELRSEADKIAA